MPDVSFLDLAIVAGIAFGFPLPLGLVPRLRLPSPVLEIVAGIVVGPAVLGWVKLELVQILALIGLASCHFRQGWRSMWAGCAVPVLTRAGIASRVFRNRPGTCVRPEGDGPGADSALCGDSFWWRLLWVSWRRPLHRRRLGNRHSGAGRRASHKRGLYCCRAAFRAAVPAACSWPDATGEGSAARGSSGG